MAGWSYFLVTDGVMTRKGFPHDWFFVRGIHQWLADSPHKGPVTQSFDNSSVVGQKKLLAC